MEEFLGLRSVRGEPMGRGVLFPALAELREREIGLGDQRRAVHLALGDVLSANPSAE